MSERRKRKSFWDMEEEAKHLSSMNEPNSWSGKERHCNYDDRRYHGLSSSGTSSTQKSLDNSGRASWETNEENPTAVMGDGFVKRRQDASEVKEIGGVNRYFKNMSPGFDGMERRNCNNSFVDDRSHSRRYPARGRSQSRGRSRSRSLSRGRGRERERGRGWSRSRSRSNDSGQSRSRSPIEDYRRESCGWSDRTRGPDRSSKNCRDFVAGNCRRGSQCRFLHPSDISHRDGDRLEDDPAESWRNKVDRIRTLKHAYSRGPEYEMQDDDSEPNRRKVELCLTKNRNAFPCKDFNRGNCRRGPEYEMQDDDSEPNRRKDELCLTKNRNAFPCKDFNRGNCRWADSCKFSHHSTPGESFGKSFSVRSFDKDSGHQSNQYDKPICKFFAVGKCDRNNCRFSHEVINKGSLHQHDKSNWSDDVMRVSDAANTVGWGEKNVADTKSTGDISNEVGNGMENEDTTWGVLDWKKRPSNREKQPSPPRESSSHDQDISYTESVVKATCVATKLEQLILLNSQLQNQDEFLNVQQHNSLQGHHSFSVKALQQNASSTSHIQQLHPEMLQNDIVDQFVSGVLDGVKNSQIMTHPNFFPVQSLNEKGEIMFLGHSSISNETIRGQNMLYPMPSNEIVDKLNLPETKIVTPLNLQAEMQNHQKAIKAPKMSESKVLQFFPNLLTNEHSTQGTNSPVIPDQPVGHVTENPATFLGQRFVNEQAQAYQSIDPSNPSAVMPSFSDTRGHVPLVNTNNAQMSPVKVSHDMFNPLENGTVAGELSNSCLFPGTKQNSQIHMKQSSPLSVSMKVDNLKVNHQENVMVKLDEVTAKPENEALGEQSKDDKENKASETLDGHGKNEGGNATKDEKGVRLFKNSLVEFVKEILKPTWKEGRMSREAHKTVVKKVVDKVTGTIQADHVPKTQEKVEHYLSCSKPKITKLVQAYVERFRKAES